MLALAVVVATVVAFVLSFVFYSVAPAAADGPASEERPRPWQIVVELLRSAVVSGLVTGLLVTSGWNGAGQGALLGLALWALPVVLLAGSVLWEKVPVRSAALHAGDWLVKLVAIGAILGLFA
jgi:hypothetical protein